MTDTNTRIPTDAEIDAIADQHKASGHGTVWPHAFAHAVLAKWGTPAPTSQPVAATAGMEPVARLLYWRGPKHYSVPHAVVAARTYAEFSRESADKPDSYWMNGVALYTTSQVQAMLTAAPGEPLTDSQIADIYFEALGRLLREQDIKTVTRFARAVEFEVQKQDEALIRLMLEALECSGEPDDPGHRCSHCDDYVDRNSVLRNAARKRLEGKP